MPPNPIRGLEASNPRPRGLEAANFRSRGPKASKPPVWSSIAVNRPLSLESCQAVKTDVKMREGDKRCSVVKDPEIWT
jgi:hypothetical protein